MIIILFPKSFAMSVCDLFNCVQLCRLACSIIKSFDSRGCSKAATSFIDFSQNDMMNSSRSRTHKCVQPIRAMMQKGGATVTPDM